MREDWQKVKLADACLYFTDGDWIESKDQDFSGIRLIQTGNIGFGQFKNRSDKARYINEETFDRLKCKFVLEGDCLISRLPDPVGRACIIPNIGERTITAVDCTIVRFKKDFVYPDFFKYYSQSKNYISHVDKMCTGATRKRISRQNLGKVEILVPPLPEQKRIVAILNEAFEGIDRAIALAEKNLVNARELFESYLNAIFTQKNDEWVERKLAKVASKIGSGATPRGGQDAYKTEGISLIRSLNVHDRRFKIKDLAFIDDEQAEKLANVVVEEGDVLLNITGASIARSCVAPSEYLPARVNQHVSIIRPDPNQISCRFLNYLITSKPYKEKLLFTGDKAGATRQALTKAQIQDFSIHFPSIDEQKIIVEKLDLLEVETQRLEAVYRQKIAALKELKQSILQKAFTGELTADTVEKAA